MLVWSFPSSFILYPPISSNVFTSLAWCNRQAWNPKYVPPYFTKICLFSLPITCPLQWWLFSHVKYTISPGSHIKDVAVLVFALIALLRFLQASDLINAARAACIAYKWLAIISLDVWPSNAGGLSMSIEGKFGFLPKTSWFRLYP